MVLLVSTSFGITIKDKKPGEMCGQQKNPYTDLRINDCLERLDCLVYAGTASFEPSNLRCYFMGDKIPDCSEGNTYASNSPGATGYLLPGCLCTDTSQCTGWNLPKPVVCENGVCEASNAIELEGFIIEGRAGWDEVPVYLVPSGAAINALLSWQAALGEVKIILPVDYYSDVPEGAKYYDEISLDDIFMFSWTYNPEPESSGSSFLKYDDSFFNVILQCKNLGFLINSYLQTYNFESTYYESYDQFKTDDYSSYLINYPNAVNLKINKLRSLLTPQKDLCEIIVNVFGRDSWQGGPYNLVARDSVYFNMNVPAQHICNENEEQVILGDCSSEQQVKTTLKCEQNSWKQIQQELISCAELPSEVVDDITEEELLDYYKNNKFGVGKCVEISGVNNKVTFDVALNLLKNGEENNIKEDLDKAAIMLKKLKCKAGNKIIPFCACDGDSYKLLSQLNTCSLSNEEVLSYLFSDEYIQLAGTSGLDISLGKKKKKKI